jgi:hypothetical protein
MIAEDLSIYFADHAVPAAWNPSGGAPQKTADVILDEPDELVLGEQVIVSNRQITYASTDLAGLDEGETLTVDGMLYRVRERPKRIDDGRLMTALISKV